MKEKLWYKILDIVKYQGILPWYLRLFYCVLFPFKSLCFYFLKTRSIYGPVNGCFNIGNNLYPLSFFKVIEGSKVGDQFEICQKEDNSMIIIKSINNMHLIHPSDLVTEE
ncbi:unnamed protein product, partial [marine sediment metagenome]